MIKYPSMDNTYNEKAVRRIKDHDFDGIWYVTEKIHGANLGVVVESNMDVTFMTRRTVLSDHEAETFYKLGQIKESVKDAALKLHQRFHEHDKDFVVYGELCGGSYDHPEVQRNNDAPMVQKGVQYSPNLEFFVFDVLVGDTFVDYKQVYDACRTLRINASPILFVGTLDECMDYNETFITKIPAILGYPEIEGNYSEGIVIKRNTGRTLNIANSVKQKNEKFSEKKQQCKTAKKQIELNSHDRNVLNALLCRVNDARIDSAESKLGRFDEPKLIGKFIKEITEGIITEAEHEDDVNLPNDSAVRSVVMRSLVDEIKSMLFKRAGGMR